MEHSVLVLEVECGSQPDFGEVLKLISRFGASRLLGQPKTFGCVETAFAGITGHGRHLLVFAGGSLKALSHRSLLPLRAGDLGNLGDLRLGRCAVLYRPKIYHLNACLGLV